jgi:hypothetical protein
VAVLGLTFVFWAPLHAQEDKDAALVKATTILLDKAKEEYRTYFKEPKTTFEFWAAIKFEIDIGKFDVAAYHLHRLLNNDKVKAEQVDEDLFAIETVEGMSSFLRLMRVQRWSDVPQHQKQAEEDVKIFFERLSAVIERKLSDPVRITKFIKQLDAETIEERAFAFKELNRSRERAVPLLIDKLRENLQTPLFAKIVEAMVNLDPETVPAYLEVFKARNKEDAQDQELRLTLLRIIRNRGDRRVIPYLWHLSAAPMYPPPIRNLAKEMLGKFLEVDPEVLPPAKITLAQMSEKYFKHQVAFPSKIRLWKWDGAQVSKDAVELKPSEAEEFYGLRYALEALDLDPSYVPGQFAFLDMTLERAILQDYEKAILQPLSPGLQRLLATLDADLLLRLMDRAYEEGNLPILLGTIRTLGDRRESRAARASGFGTPRGIVRGLYYPDRRVQFLAVESLLKMPTTPAPVAANRVVDVLGRLLTVDTPPAVLVVGASQDKANQVQQSIKEAGYEPIAAKSLNEGLEKIRLRGNVEAIVLHYGLTARELGFALDQLSADTDNGRTPVLIVAPADQLAAYRKIAGRFRNASVVSETMLPSVDETKKLIDGLTVQTSIAKLTPEERKRMTEESLDVIRQMARNQIPGYDVRPTIENVSRAVNSPELAAVALEALGHMPGSAPQMRLADVVIDPSKDKLRVPAARELNRHVQHNGLLMPKGQFERLVLLYNTKDLDAALKTELAYFMGIFRSTPRRDGTLILDYRPDVPAAAPAPAEKKDAN